jgi:hypothetical protein
MLCAGFKQACYRRAGKANGSPCKAKDSGIDGAVMRVLYGSM